MPYERPTFDRKEWHEKFLTAHVRAVFHGVSWGGSKLDRPQGVDWYGMTGPSDSLLDSHWNTTNGIPSLVRVETLPFLSVLEPLALFLHFRALPSSLLEPCRSDFNYLQLLSTYGFPCPALPSPFPLHITLLLHLPCIEPLALSLEPPFHQRATASPPFTYRVVSTLPVPTSPQSPKLSNSLHLPHESTYCE
jgi:hypothetical protein